MKVTIFGTAGPCPGRDEACSGFLVQQGMTNLLIDCGTGVLGKLQQVLALEDVTDVLVSHMHADHFVDLIPWRYAVRYGMEAKKPKTRLHLPPGGEAALEKVIAPFSESATFMADAFSISEYSAAGKIGIGPLELSFASVRHYIDSYAVAIRGKGLVAYSSDTGTCRELSAISAGADLLVANVGACLQPVTEETWGHLTPQDAGKLASAAGVRRLLITHLWPWCDRDYVRREARAAFNGTVDLATPMMSFSI